MSNAQRFSRYQVTVTRGRVLAEELRPGHAASDGTMGYRLSTVRQMARDLDIMLSVRDVYGKFVVVRPLAPLKEDEAA